MIEVCEKGHIFRILVTSEGAVYFPGKGVGKYLVTTGAAWDSASNTASPTDSSKKRIGKSKKKSVARLELIAGRFEKPGWSICNMEK